VVVGGWRVSSPTAASVTFSCDAPSSAAVGNSFSFLAWGAEVFSDSADDLLNDFPSFLAEVVALISLWTAYYPQFSEAAGFYRQENLKNCKWTSGWKNSSISAWILASWLELQPSQPYTHPSNYI
jgi:hypothetical protein